MRRPSLSAALPFALLLAGCAAEPEPPLPGPGPVRLEAPQAIAASGYVLNDDGVLLYYEVLGDGPEVVLLPARLYLIDAFRVRPELTEGRRLVFYDMRDRGRSETVDDPDLVSVEGDIADLEVMRQAMGAERVSLVGFSYLGKVVVLYALRHPEHVLRIVQLGPVPRKWDQTYPPDLQAPDLEEFRRSFEALEPLKKSGMPEQRPEAYCEQEWEVSRRMLVGDPAQADEVPNPCLYRNEWPSHLQHHFELSFRSMQELDVEASALAAVTVPVLTIHGTLDRNAPFGGGRQWAAELPNARLLTVRGAAHCSWIDEPAIVFRALDDFLRGDWPAAAVEVRGPAIPGTTP